MLKEKNPLLYMKLKKEKSFFFKLNKNITESLYSLFDLILEDLFENIWYEYINIILGYLQLIMFIFDQTVS